MAGNNSIRILRGNDVKSTAASEVLLDGQPLYDRTTGYFYVGENRTVASTQAVNAHYANTAGTASSSSYATYSGRVSSNLVINSGASSVNYIGNVSRTIYAPTSLGTSGQVWGIASNGRAAWIAQTEIPGTIENANFANTAENANFANTAENANFANTAGKVEGTLELRIANTNVSYNGSADKDFTSKNIVATTDSTQRGGIPYSIGQGTNANIAWLASGEHGDVLRSRAGGGIAWGDPNALNVNSANSANFANFANTADVANSVVSNLNINIMGVNYTYDGSSLVNISNKNIVASSFLTHRGAIPYAYTNGSAATPATVAWLAKGNTGQVLTATSTGIAWQTLNTSSTSSLPSNIAVIDDSSIDVPITASTYMLTKVIGENGYVSFEHSGAAGVPSLFGNNSFVVVGIRPDANYITISYSNGTAVYSSAGDNSITRITFQAPSGTRYIVTKLSDD